jgi:1-acyl-sn-glycerol-3-phosphate acyltransferase
MISADGYLEPVMGASQRKVRATAAPPVLQPDRWYYRYGYIALSKWLARYHRAVFVGDLPEPGPCIYVAHHGAGYLNLDLVVACFLVGWERWYERAGPFTPLRIVAAQGHAIERAIPGLPVVKRHVGLIDPSEASCLAVLNRGEQLLVTPGGQRESMPDARDYRLKWRDRYGFVRLALATGTPIVPLSVVGGFDAFPGFRYRKLSIWSPVPLPVRLDVAVGTPIQVPQQPTLVRDEVTVKLIHEQAWRATQALYDRLLAQRGESSDGSHVAVAAQK